MPDHITEASNIDSADLFDKEASRILLHFDLGPKRRRSSAARCRGDEDDRSRKEFVSLNDDAEAVAVLLVTDAFGKLESVDVTPEHAATP